MNKDLKNIIVEISKHASKGRLFEMEIPAAVDKDQVAPPAQVQPEVPNAQVEKQNAEQDQKEADQAKADAAKAKEEKEKAEQDIEQFSSIKLTSKAGVTFLLGKLLEDAVRTNKMDSLANDFSQKLKIDSKEGLENFKNNTVQFSNLKGYANLLEAIEALIQK